MKTNSSRCVCSRLRSAFALVLLVLASSFLLQFATSAQAQIFVSDSAGSVSLYDGGGHLLNANFITGLGTGAPYGYPEGLALVSSDLYVVSWYGTLSKYNAFTGAAENMNYITGLQGNPYNSNSIAISGSTLYVGKYNGPISTYDLNTGNLINYNFISTGFTHGAGLAISGNQLYASDGVSKINIYDATTGSLIKDSFITDTQGPDGMTVYGSMLFVTYPGVGKDYVNVYDLSSGNLLQSEFISGAANCGGIAVMAVPEPSAYASLAGLLALGTALYRRRRQA